MRINAFRVARYGSLDVIERHRVGNFLLVHGANEQGKTLLLDALVRLLFSRTLGRRIQHFGNMARVATEPDGHVVVAMHGEEKELGQSRSLDKLLDVDAVDFRNVFVVRDSDLTIPKERDYFTEISERLTGLRTSEIERIKRVVQRRGMLTSARSNADVADNVETGHVKRKVLAASRCVERIDEVRQQLADSGFEELERERAASREEQERLEQEQQTLQQAGEIHRLRDLAARLDDLHKTRARIVELDAVTEKGLDRWRHAGRERTRIEGDIEALRERIRADREAVRVDGDRLADATARLEGGREQLARFGEHIGPLLDRYAALEHHVTGRAPLGGLWWGVAWAGAGVGAVGLIAAAWRGGVLPMTVAVVALGGAVVALARLWRDRRVRGRFDAVRSAIVTGASRLGLRARSFDEVLGARARMERDVVVGTATVDEIRVRQQATERQILDGEGTIRNLRDQHAQALEAIEQERVRSGRRDLDDYQRQLAERKAAEQHRAVLEATLRRELGTSPSEASDDVQHWERLVAAGREDVDTVPADAERERWLGERIETLRDGLADVERALSAGRQSLRETEAAARDSGAIEPRDAICRTTAELDALRERLSRYINDVEKRKDDAITALRILERVEERERARVLELFGADQPVSRHFAHMTDGAYREVSFDPEQAEIWVTGRNGELTAATSLSGGTLDQLYLSIRLSLAEGMMGGEPGFLLLDDPFVKSDRQRLQAQLGVLRDLVGAGWQVLLFSAKAEVLEALEADVSAGRVDLLHMSDGAATAARSKSAPGAPTRVPGRGGDPLGKSATPPPLRDLFSGS